MIEAHYNSTYGTKGTTRNGNRRLIAFHWVRVSLYLYWYRNDNRVYTDI